MTVTQINSGNIVSGTISASKIVSGTIDNSKEYENDIISYDKYNHYGFTVKNCVVFGVPKWSSMFTMIGNTDSFGNLFTA